MIKGVSKSSAVVKVKSRSENLNKYQKRIMFNISVMQYVLLTTIVFNLFLPMYKPFSFGFTSIWQWASCVIIFIGFLYGIGYFSGQKVMLVPWTILRVIEILYYLVFKKVIWILLSVGIITDLIFIALLIMDKSRYEYRVED